MNKKELERFYLENKDRQIKTIEKALKFNKYLAEDIIQQAYEKAFRYLDSYDENKASFNTWFNKIMFNELKNFQLKNKVERTNEDTVVEEEDLNPKFVEELRHINNPQHRKILACWLIGYSSKEIPNLIEGVSQTNVTTIVNRFRDNLKKKYECEL